MLEFLVHKALVLHSPPVLLLRGLKICEFCNAKLGSNSVGIAHFTQNWLEDCRYEMWRKIHPGVMHETAIFINEKNVPILTFATYKKHGGRI